MSLNTNAEVAGELRAALPVDGGAAVADPFGHTLALVALLERHRRQTHTEREEICHDARPEHCVDPLQTISREQE